MFVNKNNAFKRNTSLFFVSLCFFALTFLKPNSITFRFSLTWRHTNYRTIKFFPLYLQNPKNKRKVYMKHWKQAVRRFLAIIKWLEALRLGITMTFQGTGWNFANKQWRNRSNYNNKLKLNYGHMFNFRADV